MNRRFVFLWLIVVFVLAVQPARAQSETERDSLESLLPFANDLQRADILNGLANCLKSQDTAKAGNYVRQALVLSEKLNYCKGQATATVLMGILYKNRGELVNAKRQYLSGLTLALKCKEPVSVSLAYHSLGNLAYMEGNLGKAMRYYIASVKISEQTGDYTRAARTYNNIGTLYLELKNSVKAEEYYLRSLELYKGGDDDLIVAEIENNLANIYQSRGYELKALYHYTNALEVFRKKSSASDISSALNNIGLVYLARKQPRKAFPFLYESYQIDLQVKEPHALMMVIANLASAYLDLNKPDSALILLKEGLMLNEKYPNLPELAELYQHLSVVYARKGDKQKQQEFLQKRDLLESQLSKENHDREVGIAAAEFENERKEHKLKLMAKENEINLLKIQEQEATIERRNLLLIVTGIIIFFLLLLTGLVFFALNLNKKNKLFEMSSKAKGNMLQQINHEIRTPLNGIVGMSQLAMESKTFTELKEYLSMIKMSSDELMFVLNNLITYLQIDRKEAQPVAAPFNLIEALEDLFRIYSFQCKQKGLLFSQMVFPGIPAVVNADQQKLINMIQNLLSNAVKVCEKGVVKVEVRKSASRVKDKVKLSTLQISVIDEGPGMSEKEIKNLFKGEPRLNQNVNGFGIGLRNVKELCDLMKGHLEVISEKGVGSSFILEVEVEELSAPEVMPLSQKQNRIIDRSKQHILIVEDNKLNQKLLVKILEKEGYSYYIAENGLEALNLIREKTFDLILMDIRMPVMDGIEATHHLRTNEEFGSDKNIPVIAVTAHDDAQEKKKCFDVGMNGYITKPIQKEQFLKKISEFLEA